MPPCRRKERAVPGRSGFRERKVSSSFTSSTARPLSPLQSHTTGRLACSLSPSLRRHQGRRRRCSAEPRSVPSSVPSRPRACRSSRATNGPTGCSSGGGVSKVGEEDLVTRPTRRRRPPRRPPRPRRRSAARVKRPLLAARAATLSRPCGHPPPRRPARACSGQLASGSEPRGEPSPLGCRSDAAAAALSVAGPNAAYFAVPPTTQAAEAPPPVVLPPQPVGCAAAEAVGAAGAHGPHSSHNGPPRAVGRGASRVTDAYGARARAGCTWLGSLFQEIASIPISILYSSAVPLGSSRKISLCVRARPEARGIAGQGASPVCLHTSPWRSPSSSLRTPLDSCTIMNI